MHSLNDTATLCLSNFIPDPQAVEVLVGLSPNCPPLIIGTPRTAAMRRPSIFKLDRIASASSSPHLWLAIMTSRRPNCCPGLELSLERSQEQNATKQLSRMKTTKQKHRPVAEVHRLVCVGHSIIPIWVYGYISKWEVPPNHPALDYFIDYFSVETHGSLPPSWFFRPPEMWILPCMVSKYELTMVTMGTMGPEIRHRPCHFLALEDAFPLRIGDLQGRPVPLPGATMVSVTKSPW